MQITDHTQLRIYQDAYAIGLDTSRVAGRFPEDERYRMTDQTLRCCRAPAALIAEAFRKRHYPAVFNLKLLEAEGEAAETRVWLSYAKDLGYVDANEIDALDKRLRDLLVRVTNTRLTAPSWARVKQQSKSSKPQNDAPPPPT